jgi:opacity protein-like surface antigen
MNIAMSFRVPIKIVLILMFLANQAIADAKWDGYFVGIGIGSNNTTSKQSYSHSRTTALCDNNNYGSIGNGANCVNSNEDYQKEYKNKASLGSIDLRAGKYWSYDSYVLGLFGAYNNSNFDKTNYEVISSGFGDTLSISSKQKDSLSVLGLVGLPMSQFMPYITAGISNADIESSVTQSIVGTPPLNLPRTFSSSQRKTGYALGGGIKWMISESLIIGGEYLFTNYGSMKSDAAGYMPPGGGGNKYPVTNLNTEIYSSDFKINLEYKF